MSDFDSRWKDALDRWFPAFMAFFFPDTHPAIDWARGHEMLDKELQQVVREAEVGRRHVDKLVKVWRRDGVEAWVLIHVEVQSQPDDDFPKRMFVYHYRLFDRYNQDIVSLAVLADERPDWRPNRFETGLWGCNSSIVFPVAKLLDYAADEAALEANANPFAVIALTHRKTQQTRGDADRRKIWKLRLVRGLYERGLDRQDMVELFRFIDWMMDLPDELTRQFWQDHAALEKEKHMPYITSVERLAKKDGVEEGREEGLREGLLKAVELGLELKFGARGKRLMARVRRVADNSALDALYQLMKTADSLDEVRKALP